MFHNIHFKVMELSRHIHSKCHPRAELPMKEIIRSLSGKWELLEQLLKEKADKLNAVCIFSVYNSHHFFHFIVIYLALGRDPSARQESCGANGVRCREERRIGSDDRLGRPWPVEPADDVRLFYFNSSTNKLSILLQINL